eukprot:4134283-Prymnesium_polylepis.1
MADAASVPNIKLTINRLPFCLSLIGIAQTEGEARKQKTSLNRTTRKSTRGCAGSRHTGTATTRTPS